MFENIHQDLKQSVKHNLSKKKGIDTYWLQLLHPGTQAVLVYRFGHWASQLKIPVIKHLLLFIYFFMKYLVCVFIGVNIPTSAKIAGGLVVHTWTGVYIPACKIGHNAYFQQGVNVIYNCKEIGDNVYFGPGCKVIRPIRIGHNARIGANAVVIENVADGAVVVGIPAKVVKQRN